MSNGQYGPPNSQRGWTCEEIGNELGSWALGALEPDEMAEVEQHISTCGSCRHEASHLSQVASMLPFASPPVSPSAHAKMALMSRIAHDQMRTSESRPPAFPPVSPGAGSTAGGGLPPRIHWSQALIAPLAIALLVMTLWSFELRGQVNDEDSDQGAAATTTAMLPAGVQTYSLKSECEKCRAAGKLLADPEKADALMVAWNLDPSQVHQVWCIEGDGSKALVASLEVTDTGDVVQPLIFDQPIADYSQIYVMSHTNGEEEWRMDIDDVLSSSSTPEPDKQH